MGKKNAQNWLMLVPNKGGIRVTMMRASRTLSIVGASEESVAHVRLLLRMAGTRLEHDWDLKDGNDVDLILLEPGDEVSSKTLQARYQSAGIPFAIVCDADAVVVHGLVLRRPIKLGQLVAVLNAAGALRADTEVLNGATTDFYSTELGDQIPSSRTTATWDRPEHAHAEVAGKGPATSSGGTDSFKLLVDGDPLVEPTPSTPLIGPDTQLEPYRPGTSARSAMRHDETGTLDASLLGTTPMDVEPMMGIGDSAFRSGSTRNGSFDPAKPVLAALLADGAILSPTRLSGDGLPDLVLDPKLRCYYSPSGLEDLQPYVSAGGDRVQTARIVGTELQQVRDSQASRPFDELRWLLALIGAQGHLESSLDPGGSYAVTHALECAPELHSHGSIVALMATPMQAHVLARVSGATMAEVFDVISAYHAIDRLQYVPRQSLQGNNRKGDRSPFSRLFSRK